MLSLKPTGEDAEKFEVWWTWSNENLRTIFDYDNASGRKQFPLEKMLKNSLTEYLEGKESSINTLFHIHDFIIDMEFLLIYRPCLFTSYKNKFSSGPAKQYHYLTGIWFELRVARLFLEKGIEFKSPDPPDFEVNIESQIISIECYSPRVIHGTPIYPNLLNSVINRKVKKYRNQPWTENLPVLFLDGNWIIRSQSNGVLDRQYSIPDDIQDTIKAILENSFYKLVVLITSGRLTESGQNGSTISCVYTPRRISDPFLSSFVNKFLDGFKEEPEIKIMIPDLP